MTVIVLRDAVVEVADAGGELVDVSAGVAGVALRLEMAVGQYHTLESDYPKTAEGGRRGSLALTVIEDEAAGSAHGLLRAWMLSGGLRAWRVSRPDGDGVAYSGEARLARLNPASRANVESGDVATCAAVLVVDGAVVVE